MRLPEIHAALAREQLAYLERWNDARRKNAAAYNSLLEDEHQIVKPIEKEWARHVYHFYVIRTQDRDRLSGYLDSKGVGVGVHYPTPVHLQPCYEGVIRSQRQLPVTETVARTVLSLPCHPSMSHEDIEFVAKCIGRFMKGEE
jgi:dTDP-4-amino-4,6-dideoxygalactose transaminase